MGSAFILRVAAGIACVIAIVWLALWYFIPAPPTHIIIASGVKGGGYEIVARRYRERLARAHITLDVRPGDAGEGSLKAVEDRSVDAAFLLGGITNSEQSPGLLSLGRFDVNPLWFFYRDANTLDRLTQLKGKRIAVGGAGARVATPVLSVHGVKPDNTTFLPLTGPRAAKALTDGEADVVITPIALNFPVTQSLLRDPTVRLMNITQADALARLLPYLTRQVLPQGVVDLEKNIPLVDVNLIATSSVVVVRKDLHPELVYLLARTMQEEHSGAGIFQRAGEFPSTNDPEFPMAEEAVDYYKNGPSFLQRYLPFWMINYVKRVAAIVVAAVAVVIPLFTYGPRLYDWLLRSRVIRLYRRLRAVNAQLKRELSAGELGALQKDLDGIDHAANVLPMRHSDLFFALRMHIRDTRADIRQRLAELVGGKVEAQP